jgi:hypothetical protein
MVSKLFQNSTCLMASTKLGYTLMMSTRLHLSRNMVLLNILSFGLANGPAQLTLLMNSVSNGISGCVVFMDDIIVLSKTLEIHHQDLRNVLQRLREHTLYAAPGKCELYRTSVEYLGHIITPHGTRVVPAKANAVKDWPAPKNLKELRQFPGLSGFYRHFVHMYSAIAKPLT